MGGDDADSDEYRNPLGLPDSMMQSALRMSSGKSKARFLGGKDNAFSNLNKRTNQTVNHNIQSPSTNNKVEA